MKKLLHLLRSWIASWNTGYIVSSFSPWMKMALKTIPPLIEISPGVNWKIKKVYRSASDMDTLWIGPTDSSLSLILYVPRSQVALLSFEKRKINMKTISTNESLGVWRNLLPRVLYEGQFQEQVFWIEECLPGISGIDMKHDSNSHQEFLRSALDQVGFLHQMTACDVVVSDALVNRWVLSPLKGILDSPLVYFHRHSRYLLDELGRQLAMAVRGKTLAVGWIHGDYWPGNILVEPTDYRVVGIVDWEDAQSEAFPSLDLVNMIVSMRRLENQKELGEILVDMLKDGNLHPYEQQLWDRENQILGGNILSMRESLLIFWLNHVSTGLKKSWRYSANPVWVYGNFVTILNFLHDTMTVTSFAR